MKIAVLCLCLFAIAFANPIKKSKSHDGPLSSEEKHDFRGHHAHKHHHHNHHSDSDSKEDSTEHGHSHESREQHSSSRPRSDSDESEEKTEQQTLLVLSGKSKEDDHSHVDDHDDVDDPDDVDDDSHSETDDSNNSHESDESDEVITEVPIDDPLTPSAAPDPFTGRGDSPYRLRDAQLKFLRKSKESSEEFDSHGSAQEDDNIPDADSHKPRAASPESHDISSESEDRSDLKDSSEADSASRHKSAERDSRQKLGSADEDHDDSKADVPQESYETDYSTKHLKTRSEELHQADHDHDVDDVNIESVHDHHDDEDNEIKY